jgi:hypothetical protein
MQSQSQQHPQRDRLLAHVLRDQQRLDRESCLASRLRGNPFAALTTVPKARTAGDSGDGGPREPRAGLRLAPPPRAVLTFGCLTPENRGEVAVAASW